MKEIYEIVVLSIIIVYRYSFFFPVLKDKKRLFVFLAKQITVPLKLHPSSLLLFKHCHSLTHSALSAALGKSVL